jgi:hypothetical protein
MSHGLYPMDAPRHLMSNMTRIAETCTMVLSCSFDVMTVFRSQCQVGHPTCWREQYMELHVSVKRFSLMINKESVDKNHFIHCRTDTAAPPLQEERFTKMNRSTSISLIGV